MYIYFIITNSNYVHVVCLKTQSHNYRNCLLSQKICNKIMDGKYILYTVEIITYCKRIFLFIFYLSILSILSVLSIQT